MQSGDTSIPIFGVLDRTVTYKPRPAAYVLVTDQQGRIAAVKGTHHYFLPGGGSLAEETPEQTVRREVREELAREIYIIGQIGKAVQYFYADSRHYRMEAFFFAGEFVSEAEGIGEHELFWLESEQLKEGFYHESHAWAVSQLKGHGGQRAV